MVKRASRRGDTLIEVALAIGIFSMTAIAVAAVLSSSTAGAQSALESTLAREEVDTQTDALRFIQNVYAANRNGETNPRFYGLWKKITGYAIDFSDPNKYDADQRDSVLNYAPDSCSNLYNEDNFWHNNMFVINPRALSRFDSDDDIDNTVVGADKLSPATIYPRLVFDGTRSANSEGQQDMILDDESQTNLYRAEGVYILAVKDIERGTTVVNDNNKQNEYKASAFYDFYIRTCWYGTDANQPSTISTVIRLYDPDAL